MEISVKVHDEQAKQLLAAVSSRYGNLRPAFGAIGEIMTRRVDDRFEGQRDPDGNPWLPTKVLSNYLGYVGTRKGYKRKEAYTQAGRFRASFARYLEGKKILQLTGALRRDIHYQADDTHVEWGTSGRIPYAGIHQFGGMAGRGRKVKIPARPYLGRNVGDTMEIAPADRQAAIDILSDHLTSS
ncbi:phage virion morphogenesis protein [Geobacter pelophilus]|uniref:Phage virion morphogenesis protein n=1 Tax=Geoanaerobacter pelophilus TaxID=60036 RepID=A0AAW4L1C9_9BACT|nr:phage virion morphogenesis protein [Geoanaerobacter pelophilus]MBT0664771.1 phage virion morphogenesis protein [Geoanaerobacter pelophilus]